MGDLPVPHLARGRRPPARPATPPAGSRPTRPQPGASGVGAPEQRRGEGLWRLDRDQRLAGEGLDHHPPIHPFDGVDAGDRGGGRPVPAGGRDHRLDEPTGRPAGGRRRGRRRSRRPPPPPGRPPPSRGGGRRPGRSAPRSVRARAPAGRRRRWRAAGQTTTTESTENDGPDPLEDQGEEGTPGHLGPELVGPGTLAAARCRNDDRDAQRVPARVGRAAARCRPSTAGCASVAVVAKIIRPAAVWSTDVTVTCTW